MDTVEGKLVRVPTSRRAVGGLLLAMAAIGYTLALRGEVRSVWESQAPPGWGVTLANAFPVGPVALVAGGLLCGLAWRRRRHYSGLSALLTGVGLLAALASAPMALSWQLAAAHAPAAHESAVCSQRAKMLGLACTLYVQDYGRFPPARSWCDDLLPYVKERQTFVCLAARNRRCSFAYNARLAGLRPSEVPHPDQVVMIFESDRGWNAAGGRELLAPSRHDGILRWVAADGHAAAGRPSRPGPHIPSRWQALPPAP